jgi:hypothetical protein
VSLRLRAIPGGAISPRPIALKGRLRQSQPNGYDRPDRLFPSVSVPIVPGTPARPPFHHGPATYGRSLIRGGASLHKNHHYRAWLVRGDPPRFFSRGDPFNWAWPNCRRPPGNPHRRPHSISASKRLAKKSKPPIPKYLFGIHLSITAAKHEVQEIPPVRASFKLHRLENSGNNFRQ